MGRGNCFKGRQFTAEVILWAVRWYLMFPVSYRDLELMLLDRGVEVDHTTIFRWIQAYAGELEKRIRPHLRTSNGSWRVDETYVRVKGRWTYLYRAVDSRGQTIDFLLSPRRDTAAAKRFFRKAIAQPHNVNPRTLTVDKNPAYPRAVADMKRDGELWRRSRLRQCKYLTDVFDKGLSSGESAEASTLRRLAVRERVRRYRSPTVDGRTAAPIVLICHSSGDRVAKSRVEVVIPVAQPMIVAPHLRRSSACWKTAVST